MTRALLPLLGRSLLMLALCGGAAGCGDDDDDDGPRGGTGGKGGSGGKAGTGGTGGTGGAGGARAATKAECIESFDEATPPVISSDCVECACDENTAAVAACGEPCWDLMTCANVKCGAFLMDPEMLMACVAGPAGMCLQEVRAAAPGGMIAASMAVGPILQGAACGAVCAPPLPPEDDAGMGDDGGVDAGN
jgi:hypothetical protein